MATIDDVLNSVWDEACDMMEDGGTADASRATAKQQLYKDMLEIIPPELGNDLHVCKPKAHAIDPQTEGYADYSHLPKEYANCIYCGAVPSKQRFETMTEAMTGWNVCRNEARQALAKYFGESTE